MMKAECHALNKTLKGNTEKLPHNYYIKSHGKTIFCLPPYHRDRRSIE